jgi:hypothetical protein
VLGQTTSENRGVKPQPSHARSSGDAESDFRIGTRPFSDGVCQERRLASTLPL